MTVNVINNNAPTVSLTASPQNATAPATIILNATATDSDGTIAKVEFLNGTNSIATLTQAPYKTNWENVAQGNYNLTAKATDNLGASTTSTAVAVTVAATAPKIYDIHTDHIDTLRVITDSSGAEVWRWDSAPFGETLPNEQPENQASKFTFNLRFPGQYYDAETNLHYNYFRDYDPQVGRYVESDPIGLDGGINTYDYVNGRPFAYYDRFGLAPGDNVGGGAGRNGSGNSNGNQASNSSSSGRGKYETPPNPNKRPPPENRQKSGERERNVGHKNGEEHSRVAKNKSGNRGSRGARGFLPWIFDFYNEWIDNIIKGMCEINPWDPICPPQSIDCSNS